MNRTGEHRVPVKEDELARSQGIPCGHPVWAYCVGPFHTGRNAAGMGSSGPWVMCAHENQGC